MDQDDEDDVDVEEVDDVTVVELDYTKEDLHVDEVMRVLKQEKSSHEGVKICIWKGTKQSLIIQECAHHWSFHGSVALLCPSRCPKLCYT